MRSPGDAQRPGSTTDVATQVSIPQSVPGCGCRTAEDLDPLPGDSNSFRDRVLATSVRAACVASSYELDPREATASYYQRLLSARGCRTIGAKKNPDMNLKTQLKFEIRLFRRLAISLEVGR